MRRISNLSDISIPREIQNAGISTMNRKIYYSAIMRSIARTAYGLYVGHEFRPKGDPIAAMQAAFDTCDITIE